MESRKFAGSCGHARTYGQNGDARKALRTEVGGGHLCHVKSIEFMLGWLPVL